MNAVKAISIIFLSLLAVSCNWLGRQAGKGIDNVQEAVGQIVDTVNEDIAGIEDFVESLSVIPEERPLEEIENIMAIMTEYPELEGYKPYISQYGDGVFHITGNFYGDRDDDLAILIIHEDDSVPKRYEDCVKICIINKGEYGIGYVVFDEEDEFRGGCGYDWVGVFMAIPAGETLWSNYEDDFRSLAEVPWDEIVYLPYDAIYAHVAEACGGGFIFWKNDRWNWLQQE